MLKDYTAVSNWMNENFLTINYQALISEALDLIMQVELSELPVIKDNKVIGVFNFKYDRDLMNQIETTPTYVLNEGKELIGVIDKTNQINFYQSYYNENLKLKELIKWYDLSFSEAYEGLTVVDKNGVIQILNKAYS